MKKQAFVPPAGCTQFDVPVYSGKIVLTTSRRAYNKAHEVLQGSEYRAISSCRGLSTRHADANENTVYLIGVFEEGDRTLVHELVHVVFWILSHAGVPIKQSNDEAFAYLYDAIFHKAKEATRLLRKRKARA